MNTFKNSYFRFPVELNSIPRQIGQIIYWRPARKCYKKINLKSQFHKLSKIISIVGWVSVGFSYVNIIFNGIKTTGGYF